jgi:hypothetical protein
MWENVDEVVAHRFGLYAGHCHEMSLALEQGI